MAEGFVPEADYGMNHVTAWVEGAPEKSIWTGVKLRGKRRFAISTWRCERCGYLESYANA
jgi:hypothetical protein